MCFLILLLFHECSMNYVHASMGINQNEVCGHELKVDFEGITWCLISVTVLCCLLFENDSVCITFVAASKFLLECKYFIGIEEKRYHC